MMKRAIFILVCGWFCFSAQISFGQTSDTLYFSTLSLDRKDKKSFSGGDSTLIVRVDSLIMKDKSRLIFYGKKNIELIVKYAEFGKDALITGTDGKNNGTDMVIYAGIGKIKSLFVDAGGRDAFNGTKTHPNGDGGNVEFYYLDSGAVPQTHSSDEAHFLGINVQGGGHRVNAQSEVNNILDRIGTGTRPLGRLPQGQVYSGSPGSDGEKTVEAVNQIP